MTTFIFMQKTVRPGWKGKSQVKLLNLLVNKNVIYIFKFKMNLLFFFSL